ncbi:hypothetical protein SLS56_008441 [Neofusicoccum ribis]|uniref:T6SS Phospholipase effector Tle1-like catalytic domain-containing protein n=1 Tax=Neofusicoccum ribis TaxID=45134 RepID=A0ABR3SKQ0_9PEZI
MKRLILCCDGSWTRESPSSSPSNVARFSRMLARHAPIDDVAQIVFYQSGTSSSSTSSSNIDADGPLAADIAAAYHFLATNFSPGNPAAGVPADDIAVFGAGRGALVARVVVALVTEMGLLRAERLGLWGRAWRLYSSRGTGGGTFWGDVVAMRTRRELEDIEEVREAMWMGVGVRVVGAWDTVRIENAFQALALDEHRAAFKPALWHLDPRYLSKTGRTPNLKQCWFPGFHETVGGSGGESGVSMKDGKDIADITLAWMCDQVDGLLAFNDAVVAEFLLGADESSSAQSSSNSTPTKPSRSTSNTSTSTNDTIAIPQGPRTAGATTTSLLVQVFVHLLHTLLSTIIAALISLTQPTPTIPNNPGHNPERHAIRTPGQYHKNLEFDTLATANDFPTNESIHPSVAHRADLFALAAVPYEPAPLREWPAATITVIAATANHQRHGSVNAINAAARSGLRGPRFTKPWPAWRYRESAEGEGAEWVRPSVPRGSSSSPSSSPAPSSSSSSSSSSRSALPFAWLLLWPLHLLNAVLRLPTRGNRPSGGSSSGGQGPVRRVSPARPDAGCSWHHERQLALSEWVIRELPGRHNFESRLLPWLVREQLARRNRKRLGEGGEEEKVWARSALGSTRGYDDVDAAAMAAPERAVGEPAARRDSTASRLHRGSAPPLHARKGSSAGLLHGGRKGSTAGLADEDRGGGRPLRNGAARTSPGVGRVTPDSAGATTPGTPGGRFSPTSGGGNNGLRVLMQQPMRRSAIKREPKEREEAVFSAGHRRSHSQTSVSWR